MKTKILFIIPFLLLPVITVTNAQSVLTLGSGTSMGVLTGADLCVNIINGSGILYGGGTICGGLVGVDPIASNELPGDYSINQKLSQPV